MTKHHTLPLRVAILTVSDKAYKGERKDTSGPALRALVEAEGHSVVATAILPDERLLLADWLRQQACHADIILTCGGTGLGPRDVTPEATRDVIDYEVPGIPEAIRQAGLRHTPHAMLSRAIAGVRAQTLIINLSGSPKAVQEQFPVIAPILAHAVALLKGKTEHSPESENPTERLCS